MRQTVPAVSCWLSGTVCAKWFLLMAADKLYFIVPCTKDKLLPKKTGRKPFCKQVEVSQPASDNLLFNLLIYSEKAPGIRPAPLFPAAFWEQSAGLPS